MANILFDGKASDMLNGRIEEDPNKNKKKYKNSALKPYAGSSHSKRNKIKLERLKRSDFGSLTSKRDRDGNLTLVQKDNFGIQEKNSSRKDISGSNTLRSKVSVRSRLSKIEEEPNPNEGAVATTRSNRKHGAMVAIDHFKGRCKYLN